MTDSSRRDRARFLALVLFVGTLSGCLAKGQQTSRGGGRNGRDGGEDFESFDGGTCSTFGCAPLDCGPGFRAVPLPGECCPTVCESTDCSLVSCGPLLCPSGTHEATLANRCCPTCVASPKVKPGESCDTAQTAYQLYFDQEVSALGAQFCDADSDCRIVRLSNACNHDCGTAVNARTATALSSALSNYAAAHCAACTTSTDTCPPIESAPFCTGGVCSAH